MSSSPTIFPYRQGRAYKNGHIPTYRRATCSIATCHRTISWADLTKGGAADSVVAKGMEQLNWFIDPENERHICARCRGLPALKGPHPPTAKTPKTEVPVMFFKSKPKFEPKTQEAPTSDVATPTPVEVERNLAAPTPLELRRIRHLLDGRYDLEGQRYKESYTDAILALTLGVPEHWVLIERELAYGPAESPESETEAQVRMLNELIAQVHDHAEEANAAVARMDQLLKDFAVKSAS